MKKHYTLAFAALLCLVCLFTGCTGKKAEIKEPLDPLECFEELYLKPKAEVLEMLGLTADDLAVSRPEQGSGYVSQQEKYLTDNLYLRINYLEDEIVYYYELFVAFDTNEEAYSAYETVFEGLQEKYQYTGLPGKFFTYDDVLIWLMRSFDGLPVLGDSEESAIDKRTAIVIRMGKNPVIPADSAEKENVSYVDTVSLIHNMSAEPLVSIQGDAAKAVQDMILFLPYGESLWDHVTDYRIIVGDTWYGYNPGDGLLDHEGIGIYKLSEESSEALRTLFSFSSDYLNYESHVYALSVIDRESPDYPIPVEGDDAYYIQSIILNKPYGEELYDHPARYKIMTGDSWYDYDPESGWLDHEGKGRFILSEQYNEMLKTVLSDYTIGKKYIKNILSPPDISIMDLAACIYYDSVLSEIAQFEGPMAELNTKHPIECIREVNDFYRISYLGDSKIAVLIFDKSGNKLMGGIHNLHLLRDDFEGLREGQSLNEVKSIDPDGEYLFLYTGRNDAPRVSSHYTQDGYLITIEYDDTNVIIGINIELI